MSEHVFESHVEGWERLALAARVAMARFTGSVADRWAAEVHLALARLHVSMALVVGDEAADFALTCWLIERCPIVEAVRWAVDTDQRWRHGGPDSPDASEAYLAAIAQANREMGG